MNKPSIGRIVVFHAINQSDEFNGVKDHPAIITRVWSDDCVNLLVFFDAHAPQARTSCSMSLKMWDWPLIAAH